MVKQVQNGVSLKHLERQHADEGGIEDIERSDALASDHNAISNTYWWRGPMVGAIASISMGTTAAYWGFSPPAAILATINADIGKDHLVYHYLRAKLLQVQATMHRCLLLSGQLAPPLQFYYLVEYQIN